MSQFHSSPAIRALAREMCRQRGFDPDAMVTRDVLKNGPNGTQIVSEPLGGGPMVFEAWHEFEPEARIAIEKMAGIIMREASE